MSHCLLDIFEGVAVTGAKVYREIVSVSLPKRKSEANITRIHLIRRHMNKCVECVGFTALLVVGLSIDEGTDGLLSNTEAFREFLDLAISTLDNGINTISQLASFFCLRCQPHSLI